MGYFVFFGILTAAGLGYRYREQIKLGWKTLMYEFGIGKDNQD